MKNLWGDVIPKDQNNRGVPKEKDLLRRLSPVRRKDALAMIDQVTSKVPTRDEVLKLIHLVTDDNGGRAQ